MPQVEPIEIYYSKTAYRFGLFAAFIFFSFGVLLTFFQNGIWAFSIAGFSKYSLLGILLMAGSIALAYVYWGKLHVTTPAIIIDDKGMTINNSLNDKKQRFVSWGTIDHIEVLEVTSPRTTNKDKFLVPVLKDSEADLNDTTKKALGALEKLNIEANASQPIRISTTFLKCSFDELKGILETKLDEYNSKR